MYAGPYRSHADLRWFTSANVTPVTQSFPVTIWSYWDCGLANAPEIVRLCVASWRKFAVGADIAVLDEDSLFNYLEPQDLPVRFDELRVQHQSDFIRLALLARHGGVWMDASIFLTQPLLHWIGEIASDCGLFLFRRPGPDREFANWFIVAKRQHGFILALKKGLEDLFAIPRIHSKGGLRREGMGVLWKLLLKFSTKSSFLASLWTREPLRRLKAFPYHIFHYFGNRLVRQPKHKAAFESMEWISADYGHYLSRTFSKTGELSMESLALAPSPVNKLKVRACYSDIDLGRLRATLQ